MTKDVFRTEKKVQNVYQRVMPSLYPKSKEKKNFIKYKAWMEKLYFNILKIPIGFLKNKTMLEFGSGTGEFSINYLLWKMKPDYVELNPLAIKKFKNYFKKYSNSKNYKIYNKSIFTFNSKKKYDFVSSLGVSHHTHYKLAFKAKSKFVKKNGFMILGIGNAAGMFQRNLQRYIVYYLSENNEKKMYYLAKYLFPGFLRRAKKYGGRTLDSIIYDNFINPKDFHPSTKEILNLAKKNGLSLYSSWPPITPMFLSDSINRKTINLQNYLNVSSMNDIFGLIHKEDDKKKINLINKKISKDINYINNITNLVNDIGTKKLPSIVDLKKGIKSLDNKNLKKLNFLNTIKDTFTNSDFIHFQKELKELLPILEKKNEKKLKDFLKKSTILFKGASGIGMNFYIFFKNS